MKLPGVVARLGRSKDRNPAGQRRALNVTSATSKFPKSTHLLKHADFQRVYQSGRRQFTGNMTIFFLRRSGGPEATGTGNAPRVGFTVGKVLGGSVERNRIRRRMREAVRLSAQACNGPIDVVFNPRKSVSSVPFAELVSEVTRALRLAAQRARTGEQK
jgi:ribonuclease P protein component